MQRENSLTGQTSAEVNGGALRKNSACLMDDRRLTEASLKRSNNAVDRTAQAPLGLLRNTPSTSCGQARMPSCSLLQSVGQVQRGLWRWLLRTPPPPAHLVLSMLSVALPRRPGAKRKSQVLIASCWRSLEPMSGNQSTAHLAGSCQVLCGFNQRPACSCASMGSGYPPSCSIQARSGGEDSFRGSASAWLRAESCLHWSLGWCCSCGRRVLWFADGSMGASVT